MRARRRSLCVAEWAKGAQRAKVSALLTCRALIPFQRPYTPSEKSRHRQSVYGEVMHIIMDYCAAACVFLRCNRSGPIPAIGTAFKQSIAFI